LLPLHSNGTGSKVRQKWLKIKTLKRLTIIFQHIIEKGEIFTDMFCIFNCLETGIKRVNTVYNPLTIDTRVKNIVFKLMNINAIFMHLVSVQLMPQFKTTEFFSPVPQMAPE
jgi:hypothetical protein